MRVLITGGCGYVGQWLAKLLLERGKLTGPKGETSISEIVLLDSNKPKTWLPDIQDKVTFMQTDISTADWTSKLGTKPESVFHLASVVSGEGELNFDKALRVNLDGIYGLLETLRADGDFQTRFVLTSTIAVFGHLDDPKQPVGDHTKQIPLTTYGMTKAISEKLVNEYTRKGYIDGRSARLPTVIVRAGAANLAASSFCSSVFREPLDGKDAVLPVELSQPMPLTSYRSVVAGIIAVHELQAGRLGHDRAVGLPAINVTAGDLLDCYERLRSKRPGMGQVSHEIDENIASICAGWPVAVDNSRAQELGLPMPPDIDGIVDEYIKDFL